MYIQDGKRTFPRCRLILGHIATILPIEMRKRCLVFRMRMYANLFKIDPNLPKNDRNRVVPSGWLIFACRSDKYYRGIMKRLALPTMMQPTSICCWLEHPSWFVGVTKCRYQANWRLGLSQPWRVREMPRVTAPSGFTVPTDCVMSLTLDVVWWRVEGFPKGSQRETKGLGEVWSHVGCPRSWLFHL